MCSKIKFTGAELKFLSPFSNIFFHNAINIISLGNQRLMEHSFLVIIAISRISSRSIFLLFSYESSQGHINNSQGKIPSPRLLMTALRQCYCWEKLDEGHYWGIKLGFQNKKTAYLRC